MQTWLLCFEFHLDYPCLFFSHYITPTKVNRNELKGKIVLDSRSEVWINHACERVRDHRLFIKFLRGEILEFVRKVGEGSGFNCSSKIYPPEVSWVDALVFSESQVTNHGHISRREKRFNYRYSWYNKRVKFSSFRIFVNTRTGNCYFAFHSAETNILIFLLPVRSFSLIERKYAVLAVVDGFKAWGKR